MTPEDLKYTEEHEWLVATTGTTVRVGITAYAQDQLGDVVFVELPKVGAAVTSGEPFGEVESTKSVSELFSPVTGTVVAVNNALDESPELVNSDPYGDGWIVEINTEDLGALDDLMDAAAYQELTEKD
ncbi:glycine cleavage system protein GcvH [Actinophytocola oryzae]|uniref:Glycine cleavage system H protein n=1 Tax=Actinophytocola oryzae TaxID=502181 RepID=A0A4R7V533_9PSEU|nr:glycine cleavage system protein GcvH [Actinophytocola oryzae]TDV42616.1 glycine cleavage system H protein [Actinophytocola oryzae]